MSSFDTVDEVSFEKKCKGKSICENVDIYPLVFRHGIGPDEIERSI